MSKQMDDLKAQVEASIKVEQSAVILIRGIAERLKDAGTDAAKLEDLRAELLSSAGPLGDAVAAVPAPEVPADGGSGAAPVDPTSGDQTQTPGPVGTGG